MEKRKCKNDPWNCEAMGNWPPHGNAISLATGGCEVCTVGGTDREHHGQRPAGGVGKARMGFGRCPEGREEIDCTVV